MEPLAVQFALSCKPLAKSNQDASAAAELNLLFRTDLSSCRQCKERSCRLPASCPEDCFRNQYLRHLLRKTLSKKKSMPNDRSKWNILKHEAIELCLRFSPQSPIALSILHTQLLGGRWETLGKAVAPTNCCADSPATDKTTWEEPNHKSVLDSCIRLCRTPGSRLHVFLQSI